MGTTSTLFIVLLSFVVHVSLADKPSDLSQAVFCEGCSATVKEILKKVDKKTGENREVRVVEAMEDICNLQNFGSYEYSPPKTGKACKYLIEYYDEDIENIFAVETENLEQKICYELTKACLGVDRSKKEKEEMDVRINDRKQPVQSSGESGAQMLNVDINEEGAADKLIGQINNAINEKKSNEIKEDEEEEGVEDEEEQDDEEQDDGEQDDGEQDEEEQNEDEDSEENLTDNMNEEKTEL